VQGCRLGNKTSSKTGPDEEFEKVKNRHTAIIRKSRYSARGKTGGRCMPTSDDCPDMGRKNTLGVGETGGKL